MFDVVRKADFPEYLFDRFRNWGAVQRGSYQPGRAGGLEGKYRSCRCEGCYEDESPCGSCIREAQSQPLLMLDTADAELIEAAWSMLPVSRVEKKLLRGYFCNRTSESRLLKDTGVDGRKFWYLMLRGAKEVEQQARIIACRSKRSSLVSRPQSVQTAAWRSEKVA
ncbi:hypothetical protein [Chromobacterium sinusclupearum]|uniref:hypothetical protein n=1 Tax=Chromobacterium sinusclupearum TaxID=2077146 RepID=UPI0011AF0F60|nr:hypothetical protein [Chromobacterium sinusclupearum]